MPSHKKFARAPLWCALSLAFGLAVTAPQVDAAGLGRLTVTSGLGQPLRAELEVTSVGRDELPTLQVRMAPLAAFRAANLDFNPALTNLRFGLDKRPDGSYFVRINSAMPVNEPYLDLMVELTWATGRVIREYTVLLDPPSLRADAPVVPPVASTTTPAPSTLPAAPPAATRPSGSSPSTTPTARETPPRPAPAATPPRTAPSSGSYIVKSGDTLGAIARQNKPASVSLDQMLVAMLRANPDAFVANNMNRLKAGATLSFPSESDVSALAQPDARKEVVAQSADFAQYKSRLAQAAGSAPAVATAPPAAAGTGRVTARVQDKSVPAAPTGDQLKIARAETKGAASAAAAAKADEAAAKARALREEQERAAQLKATNDAIQKALQVQSKAGAAAQKQAESKGAATAPTTPIAPPPVAVAPPAPTPIPAPVVTPTPAPTTPVSPPGTPPVTPTPIDSAKSAPTATTTPTPAPVATAPTPPPPAPVVAPPPPPPPVATTPPAKKAAPPPPRQEPGFFAGLFENTTTLLGLGLVIALLAALAGWSWYRKRRAESGERFKETGEGATANSLFGATGGQSVDTGTSTFNSSFIPAASQLDSNEVDPVAEADVYIAYGREEQAEDILKEALRLQPDRHAVRVKLMEIYARRGDKTSFMVVAEELRQRTGATGEDWERAIKVGRTVDPTHAMFAGAAMANGDRGPTTGFRIDPANTRTGRPSTLGGGATAGLDLGGLTAAGSTMARDTTSSSVPPLTQMVVDTRMGGDSQMSVETKMPQDTKLSGPTTQAAPTTQFQATLPPEQKPAPRPAAPGMEVVTGAPTDFGSLDFDLGPTKMGSLEVSTRMPVVDGSPSRSEREVFAPTEPQRAEAPAVANLDMPRPKETPKERYPAMAPTATGVGMIPDLDLNIPPPTVMPVPRQTRMPIPPSPAMEEALSRPTVIGIKPTAPVGSLPDEQAARLTANTDQATVPLIDFDLSAVSLDAATKRGETEPGSALAQQMATKLDLARGYIDLGVKDGARELLDEVMRDGTREQRQSAVDLIKQIET